MGARHRRIWSEIVSALSTAHCLSGITNGSSVDGFCDTKAFRPTS